jgi:hypothetical protein
MALLHAWPSLLTQGARGGGKVHSAASLSRIDERTFA